MEYDDIRKNKVKTFLISTVFMVMIYFIIRFILEQFNINSYVIISVAVGIAVLSTFASYWNSDKIVLASVRARKAETFEEEFVDEMLSNLCIAGGLETKPRLYIIDTPQMNAFATGRDAEHSVICVTSGLLEKLNHVEVEAVLAHELSHIIHNDMAVTAVISVMAGLIVILADIATRGLWYGVARDNDSDSGSPVGAIIAILMVVFVIISPVVSQLLQLLVSRKREYMADAGAVKLTRNPEAMISALVNIHQATDPMASASKAVDPMFIASPYVNKRSFSGKSSIFSSHPTLEERIKAIRALQ